MVKRLGLCQFQDLSACTWLFFHKHSLFVVVRPLVHLQTDFQVTKTGAFGLSFQGEDFLKILLHIYWKTGFILFVVGFLTQYVWDNFLCSMFACAILSPKAMAGEWILNRFNLTRRAFYMCLDEVYFQCNIQKWLRSDPTPTLWLLPVHFCVCWVISINVTYLLCSGFS